MVKLRRECRECLWFDNANGKCYRQYGRPEPMPATDDWCGDGEEKIPGKTAQDAARSYHGEQKPMKLLELLIEASDHPHNVELVERYTDSIKLWRFSQNCLEYCWLKPQGEGWVWGEEGFCEFDSDLYSLWRSMKNADQIAVVIAQEEDAE